MSTNRYYNEEVETAFYHLMGSSIDDINHHDGYAFTEEDKTILESEITRFCKYYQLLLLELTVMDNHFHIIIARNKEVHFTLIQVSQLFQEFTGSKYRLDARGLKIRKEKENINDISHCMMRFRSQFAQYYNKKENRKGTLWNGPFKAVELKDVKSLTRCLIYVMLNPVRAKIIDKLEDYKFCTSFKYKETGIDSHPYKENIIKSFRYLNPDLENYSDAEIWQSFCEDFQEIYSAYLMDEDDAQGIEKREQFIQEISYIFENVRAVKTHEGELIGLGYGKQRPIRKRVTLKL